MNKIKLIINREYLSRVKKKSFIVMTILGPLLFAGLIIGPAWLAQMEDTDLKKIAVIDSTHLFVDRLPETEYIQFDYLENTNVNEIKESFKESDYYAVLYISHIVTYVPNAVRLYSDKQPSFAVKSHIANAMEKFIEHKKMDAAGIDPEVVKSIETNISISTIQWTESGEEKESSTELAMIIGYIGGFLIYFFIFMFGAQVMRGVIEEKTSRIVEIIVSSAKPFQLMMGKIIGLALVGLTQFMLWILLTFAIVGGAKAIFFPDLNMQNQQQQEAIVQDMFGEDVSKAAQESQPALNNAEMGEAAAIFTSLQNINLVGILGAFLFYFLGGYLLYSSLFAAVGSAVDNEADTQQFMLPITIPLILSIIVMMNAIQSPQGPLAFWFSMIPFTSPIIMMVRIPFGVPTWELALSMFLMVITFIGTVWLAGRIYRTGILMYGKKVNYKELWKWIRYKL